MDRWRAGPLPPLKQPPPDESPCDFLSINGAPCGRTRPYQGTRWCQTHAKMLARGEPLRPIRLKGKSWRICEVSDCGRKNSSGGLCVTHAKHQRLGQPLTEIDSRRCPDCPHPRMTMCGFNGCFEQAKSHGLCQGHAAQRRRGYPLKPLWENVTRPGTLTKAQLTRRANELRRARTLGADCRVISDRDWRRLTARFNGLCAYCQNRPWTERDHIIPLKKGGRYAIGNLLPVCHNCNDSKNARLLVTWKRTITHGQVPRPANLDTYTQRDQVASRLRIQLRGPLP